MNILTFNFNTFLLIAPELLLSFGSVVILIFGVFYSSINKTNVFINVMKPVAFLIFFLVSSVIYLYWNLINYNFVLFNHAFYSNTAIVYFKIFLLIVFLVIFIFSYSYIKLKNITAFEFLYLIFFSFIALIFLLSANNFVTFYLLIELYNLAAYAAIGLRKNSNFSLDSAIKYFIFGSTSSLLLLASIAIFYSTTGCLNFMDLELFISTIIEIDYVLICALFFLFLSLFIKVAAAPFHFWAVDVYDGAPLNITFYLSLVPKLVYLFIFINFFFNIFASLSYIFFWFFFLSIIFSCIFGVFGAIYQSKIKRLVIYSMIFNLSFFFIPFLINNYFTLIFFFYFLVIYVINMIGLFFILINLYDLSRGSFIKNIAGLTNLYSVNPFLALSLSIILFSLAGLPPFAGFFPKFYLLLNLVIFDFFFLFFFLIIFSSLALFYYIRIAKIIFFSKSNSYPFLKPINLFDSSIIAFVCVFNVFFIFFSNYLLLMCHEFVMFFF